MKRNDRRTADKVRRAIFARRKIWGENLKIEKNRKLNVNVIQNVHAHSHDIFAYFHILITKQRSYNLDVRQRK